MGKIAVAKGIVRVALGLMWTVILGVVGLIVWLLWLWACAHFVSFAWVMGIILVAGLAIGGFNALDWAIGVLQDEEHENKLSDYRVKYGENANPPKVNGDYLWHKEPRGTSSSTW